MVRAKWLVMKLPRVLFSATEPEGPAFFSLLTLFKDVHRRYERMEVQRANLFMSLSDKITDLWFYGLLITLLSINFGIQGSQSLSHQYHLLHSLPSWKKYNSSHAGTERMLAKLSLQQLKV